MTDEQPKNPLHGITLKFLVEELVQLYGFEELAKHVKIRCFSEDPSVSSTLKFLRRTEWARKEVEGLYLAHLRALKRHEREQAREEAREQKKRSDGV